MLLSSFFQTVSLLGRVKSVDPAKHQFKLSLLTGDEMEVRVGSTTYYLVLDNIDGEDRNRVDPPKGKFVDDVGRNMAQYVTDGRLISITGIYSSHGAAGARFDARKIVLMHTDPDRYGWEDTHWWRRQITLLTEQWLNALYQDRATITKNDVAQFYQTNLDLLGGRRLDNAQECATLSRFLYGLSSCYLLCGNERAFWAAKATAEYLCENFSETTHDQHYCFWKFARVQTDRGQKDIIASQNYDDQGSYALYEQIYALSGLTQYFRITHDRTVLNFIRMTVAAFQDFFHDREKVLEIDGKVIPDPIFTGKGGYFSHIDPVTMRPDSPKLDMSEGRNNRGKKNWNSTGDHIPAYLINLLLTIDPAPPGVDHDEWQALIKVSQDILDDCVTNILDHFFETGCDYVWERFKADWTPDLEWGWQQDRAIVGHNLKIAWNLTRCAHYYQYRRRQFNDLGDPKSAGKYGALADRCYARAKDLGEKMGRVGMDLVRGGLYDAVERKPKNDMPVEFAWGTTKDFWQQEQAILGYYILYGIDKGRAPEDFSDEDRKLRERFLELGRYSAAFWNLHLLDRDNRKTFFRVTETGEPVIEGQYGIQSGHAIAGYHAFELSYLAHLYMRMGISGVPGADQTFTISFKPVCESVKAINVLPDFVRPDEVEILTIRINGDKVYDLLTANSRLVKFQVPIAGYPCYSTVVVEFRVTGARAMSAEDQLKLRPTANYLLT
jgi:hypothetical protein